MNIPAQLIRTVIRFVFAMAFVALFGTTALHPPGAGAQGDGPSQNATTEIQVCEAMGGEAEVTVDRHGDYLTVYVECKGGAMDGFKCINDTDFTDCMFSRFDPDHVITVPEPGGIKPVDEPVTMPSDVVAVEPEVIAPIEPDATATPDTGGEVIIDPVITDPVVTDPVVSDGDATVTPEPTAEPGGDGGVIIDDSVVVAPPIDVSVEPDTNIDLIPVEKIVPIGIDGLPRR
jgi:hypothetical protein